MLYAPVRKNGFTVVELIVIIVVIGILAAISIVSYGAWQKNITLGVLKSDLTSAANAMEASIEFGASYPSSVPSTFQPSDTVTVTVADATTTTYCLNATSTKVPGVTYYIDKSMVKTGGAKEGNCATRTASIGAPAISLQSSTGSSVTLSWSNVSGAAAYRIEYSTSSTFATFSGLSKATSPATVSGLTSGTTYYFRVKSTIESGYSAASNTVSKLLQSGWTVTVANDPSGGCATSCVNPSIVTVGFSMSATTISPGTDVTLGIPWSCDAEDCTTDRSSSNGVPIIRTISVSGTGVTIKNPSTGAFVSSYQQYLDSTAGVSYPETTTLRFANTISGSYTVSVSLSGPDAYELHGSNSKVYITAN